MEQILFSALMDGFIKAAQEYSVYRVPLSQSVWNDSKFSEANKSANKELVPYYIGSTGLSVDARFAKHKAGVKHNKYVKDYGKGVSQESKHSTWDLAHAAEKALASKLRSEGHPVYQK